MSSHYESLDAYNADVEKARTAYSRDMAVQNDLCAICQVNRRHIALTSRSRRCLKCKKAKRIEHPRTERGAA